MELVANKKFVNIDGSDLLDEKKNIITLKDIAVRALCNNFQGEESLEGDIKVKRWELAMKIQNAEDVVDLKVEEIADIKKFIGKMYGVIIVGQAWKMIDG